MKNIIFVLIASLAFNLNISAKSDRYIIVDFSKPSTEKRLYVIENNTIIYSTYVAHGRGSSNGNVYGIYATTFSNKSGSYKSSLGSYRIAEVYYGAHGKSYKLDGLDSTNSNARRRAIAIHPANYIGYGKKGTTLGCFGIPTQDVAAFYSYIKPGMILIAKY